MKFELRVDMPTRLRRSTFSGYAFWVFCVALAVSVSTAQAQVSAPPGSEPSRLRRLEVGRTVLPLLREGNVEQALKSLEAIADEAMLIAFVEEDGLSSACAGLHRALSQLSSDEQFDLLSKWSMPSDMPLKLRTVTAIVPTVSPPVEFARALGERPRKNSFEVSSIGHVEGIFDSGWSLVRAARDSGKLKQLMTRLTTLADKKVPNAEVLLALAQIADGRDDASKLAEQFARRIDQVNASQADQRLKTVDSSNVVLALASLQLPKLRPLGEALLDALLASTNGRPASRIRPFLQQAQARAYLVDQENRGEPEVASTLAPRLKYWIPVSENRVESNSPAMSDSVWLVHEDHILHVSGSGNDSLMLRYPVTGTFQFQCEVQSSERNATDGGLTYGGLGFQIPSRNYEFRVTGFSNGSLETYYCPFVRLRSNQTFNRVSVTSTPSSSTVAVNLHPMRTDKIGFRASPWIGLRCSDEFRALFRNFKLTGQPVIPRTVRLIDGQELRGWQSQVFGELADTKIIDNSVWMLDDGILRATEAEQKVPSNNVEQLLSYQRPVLAGEQVSYDFFYEPGVREVSPALGRLAFLLQSDGIRVHWVTDGNRDWTGLTVDNVVAEPLNRRGPRQLPLKSKEWNHVIIARTENAVTLKLNDVDVYQRTIDWAGDHRFGLYRSRGAIGASVRDVTLTGDWPQDVPQEVVDDPTARIDAPATQADRNALNRLMTEDSLASNVFEIRRKAFTLPAADRFKFLSRWVLPGADHPGFRMTGDFTQTEPAPVAQEPGLAHSEQGSEIVSPVIDWLEAAKELGLLAQCRQKVEQAVIPDSEFQKRARASLLSLLSLEQENEAAANADIEDLMSLLKTQTPMGVEDQWPETLVAVRGARLFGNRACVWELMSELYWNRVVVGRPPNVDVWRTHIAALFGRLQLQRQTRDDAARQSPLTLKDWIPVVATKSETSGPGYPVPFWSQQDDGIVKLAGHQDDYLFYRLPLSGDFEVECNHVQPGTNHSLIMIAGKGLCFGDFKQVLVGKFGGGLTREPIDPPLTTFEQLVHYRTFMRDGSCSIFFNGRLVRTDVREKPFDPWIAIRSWGFHQSRLQDLRISGRPEILTYVPLSASKDLTGWNDYYKEWRTGENGRWTHIDDAESSGWIVGPRDTRLAGVFKESLLRYQRPLLEDDSIEYEFFYEPGKIETNPALNRLAFILHPSGVREHWLTDGRYDRTDVAPDNVTDASQFRRGPALLPLKPDQWNQLKLTRQQGTVTVELNSQLVYERPLESENPSSFGLFHYADVTESRVRNVVMSGSWSKTLPPVADQELANKTAESLDADLTRLKSVFKHSFESDGLPDKYFKTNKLHQKSNSVTIASLPEGVQVNLLNTTSWAHMDVRPRFALSGDFDIEARFANLYLESTRNDSGIQLIVGLSEMPKPIYGHSRILDPRGRNSSIPGHSVLNPDGKRQWLSIDPIPCDAVSGRLRFSRRGQTIFYLFAESDSSNYRVFAVQETGKGMTEPNEVSLRAQCVEAGTCKVCWKDLVLRAERLMWYPDSDSSPLATAQLMQADGKGLKTLARPTAAEFTSVGFPAWSSDGRKIAMEMSKGSTATSHIVVVNVEGGQLKDLGSGCMPSFSQDGTKLVFSQPGKGIITMNSDGTNRRSIDPTGWGSQWSPDGKSIAYGKTGNINILDVETRKSHQLLVGEAATQYGYIYAGLEWSHDSRAIAFKARPRDVLQDELVIAELDSTKGPKVLHPDASNISPDCAFSPDDEQVLVSIENTETQEMQLHAINRKQTDEIQRFSHQPPGHRVTGCAWSPDGTLIVLVGKSVNEPREWSTNSDER